MSDFITTTRVNAGLAFETVVKQVRRFRHEAGQTAAEYMGVLLVVSVIIAAVATTEVGHDITRALSDLVRDIAGGDTPKK
jgi:pilus assembly protein Flp/PilA